MMWNAQISLQFPSVAHVMDIVAEISAMKAVHAMDIVVQIPERTNYKVASFEIPISIFSSTLRYHLFETYEKSVQSRCT